MSIWERKKLRDSIHAAVSICIHYGTGWPTRTVSLEKLASMGWSAAAFYKTIRPKRSGKSATVKKKSRKASRKKR